MCTTFHFRWSTANDAAEKYISSKTLGRCYSGEHHRSRKAAYLRNELGMNRHESMIVDKHLDA